jgi:hypothetical protein
MGPKRLSKVLMDEGSGLNIMYIDMFDGLGITRSELCPSPALFHSVILGHQAYPLRQIVLPITFGNASNFCTECL